jgi:superfamily II DNA or RNA helicase
MNKLSKKGYIVSKKKYGDKFDEQILELKKELTVTPQNNYNKNIEPESFKVFTEDEDTITIPKFYGLQKLGQPDINDEYEGLHVELKFTGKLKDKQIKIMDNVLPKLNDLNGGLLSLGCGEGKCLGINTEIIMYDGTIKYVQNIRVGEEIMGDDNKSRKILSTIIGKDKLYKIYDLKTGENYIVNKSHILSLKNTSIKPVEFFGITYYYGDVIDIPLLTYLHFKNKLTSFHGYRLPILNLPEIDVDIDPYEIGKNIDTYLKIPSNYKYNSYNNREKLIFGILDSVISKKQDINNIYIETKTIKLLDDIRYVFRSLGYVVYKMDDCKLNVEKLINPRNYNYLTYKISIQELDEGTYYGFEIDGNRRFMLGDCSITHNTVLSLYIACQYKIKTIVIVHKSFLLNQWKSRAKEFTNANVGIIQRNKVDIQDKEIVIGMLQSIAKDKYDPDIFKDFGLVIFDEAHHAPSKYFSRALPIINCKKTLALSATPNRSDKLEKVLFWYFGNILYKQPTETLNTVLVKMIKFDSKDKNFKEYKLNYGKDINRPKTINKLTEIISRNKLIIKIIKEFIIEEHRKLLILSDRIEHLNVLCNSINALNITTTSYYIGGMKQKNLDKSTEAQVIFATYSMAQEALDIPALNTLLMVTPRKEIEQAVGRITRKKDHLVQPTVIDIIDMLPSFDRQSKHRKKFYNLKEFTLKLFETLEDEIVNEVNLSHIKEYSKKELSIEDIDFID